MAEKKKRTDSKGRVLKDGEMQLSSGNYTFRYCTPDGKRHTIYSWRLTKSDIVPAGKRDRGASLREQEERIKRDLADGIDSTASGITLNELLKKYLSFKSNLKPNTLQTYKFTWEHYIKETIGMKKVSKVSYSLLLDFYKKLLDGGTAFATVHLINNGLIHPALRLAVRDHILRSNPADSILDDLKNTHSVKRRKKQAIPQTEMNAFLTYIRREEHSLYVPLIEALLGTGARIGEIGGLQWRDIDFENSEIHIRHQVQYRPTVDNPQVHYYTVSPKSESGTRTIPMLPEVRKAFLTSKRLQMMLGIHSATIDGLNNFVFLTSKGTPIAPQNVNDWISRQITNYNAEETHQARREQRDPRLIKPFSVHQLRHTFATLYCQHEDNLKVIADVLGHSDISITAAIYAEATADRKQKSFENLKIFNAV